MDADEAWDQMEKVRRQRWQQSVGQRETPVDLVQAEAEYCAEIERLRLTDAEREAVEQAIDAANGMGQAEPWTMRTLRGLLERLGGGG